MATGEACCTTFGEALMLMCKDNLTSARNTFIQGNSVESSTIIMRKMAFNVKVNVIARDYFNNYLTEIYSTLSFALPH